jgi:hypothetical protein
MTGRSSPAAGRGAVRGAGVTLEEVASGKFTEEGTGA